jgi:peptidoglycan/LPS O-acetylase OafA/YrhL
VIDGPAIAFVIYSATLVTATLLVRWVPVIKRAAADTGATRLTTIDGLRGFLGVGVFNHTVVTWYFMHGHAWELPPSRLVVHLGETSVSLFFMITAFLFWGRVVSRGITMDWLAFLAARLYRLAPAYLVMLGLLTAAVTCTTGKWPALLHLDFLQPFMDWLFFTMLGRLI